MTVQRPILREDEGGSFLVLEAILVAALVLTAILFFTAIQRPTTGAEVVGLDLAQVSADTLQVLQVHSFVDGDGDDVAFEQWVTFLAAGTLDIDGASPADDGLATQVDTYLDQILPSGLQYSLRITNGVAAQQILPAGATNIPHNARASEIVFLPNWAAFTANAPSRTVFPGQTILTSDATYAPLVDAASGIVCFEAPSGHVTLRDGPDAGAGADTWASHWKATSDATGAATRLVPYKETLTPLAGKLQVPDDLPLGTWRISSTAGDDVDGDCNSSPSYVRVVAPGTARVLTDGQTYATSDRRLTSASNPFVSTDAGLSVWGTNVRSGTTIATYNNNGQVQLSHDSLGVGTGHVAYGIYTPYIPYGLQLVVWFGA